MSATPITPDLVSLLERTEAHHLTRQVEVCAQMHPTLNAQILSIAGGIAGFTTKEHGRKLNHLAGIGLACTPTEQELIAIENTYAKLGLATEIDLCPFANNETVKLLAARGYTVNAFSNTYVKSLDLVGLEVSPNASVEVKTVTPTQREEFIATSVAGFSLEPLNRPAALIQTLAQIATKREETRLYIARVDGEIAGSAGLALIKLPGAIVAYLYIASTLPAYRGRGVQQALLHARLIDAKLAGAKFASVATRPTNVSSRNVARAGFELAYTRSIFVRHPTTQ